MSNHDQDGQHNYFPAIVADYKQLRHYPGTGYELQAHITAEHPELLSYIRQTWGEGWPTASGLDEDHALHHYLKPRQP